MDSLVIWPKVLPLVLVVLLLTSTISFSFVSSAVNGVVNAVTGHSRDRRDDNAPVEEVEQVQNNQQVDPNVGLKKVIDD